MCVHRTIMINHEWIKAEADQRGCRVTDLLALAPQKDPFYVGTPGSHAQGRWFQEIWQKGGFSTGIHLRRLHYWCVSQGDLKLDNGKPYENTDRCWQYLCIASKAARYLGLVSIANIADHKNPEPHVFVQPQAEPNARFWIDTPEFSDPYVSINDGNCYNLANVQPYLLEIWVEKSSMNDVLLPVCKRFCANLVTGEGEMTLTAVYALLQRIRNADRPVRVFYISDFDPAGYSMPCAVARKIEYLLRAEEVCLDVRLHRLLLNRDHVDRYALPRTPIKESERRAASFEAHHGGGCVELDALEALHPGVLSTIVTQALSHFYSREAEQDARHKEWDLRHAIRDRVSAVTARYTEHISALQQMNRELDELTVPDLEQYEPQRPEPTASDLGFTWLLDTGRNYFDQIGAYKAYAQGGDNGSCVPEQEDAA
jgi:hypothetical protein